MRRHVEYVVEPIDRDWTVRLKDGDRAGRFQTRKDAMRSAMADARRVNAMGWGVVVGARRRDGSVRTVSTAYDNR